MQIELLSPQLIDVSSDAKKVSPDAIQALAESFQQIGQRVPVEVIAGTEGRYRLVFGVKRLAAATSLGIDISAIVRQSDEFANDAQIRLTEISETLYRHELTALEHSVDVADWCAIWRAANPVRRGPKPKQELSADSALNSDDETIETAAAFSGTFSEAAQRFLKISRRNVFNALKIAGIPAELRERIALDNGLADNQQTLLDIAGQPYERAARIVELLISGEATNYADAIAIIDQIPRANPLAKRVALGLDVPACILVGVRIPAFPGSARLRHLYRPDRQRHPDDADGLVHLPLHGRPYAEGIRQAGGRSRQDLEAHSMNFGGNAAFEQADLRAEQEREAAIAAASRTLRSPGTMQCEDCGSDIARERRLALPSATRCIACQTMLERSRV